MMRQVLRTTAWTVVFAMLAAAGAYGETITGVLSTGGNDPNNPIDISKGTTDWAYYAKHGVDSNGTFAADVKAGGSASFSNATVSQASSATWSGFNSDPGDSRAYVSFSGGSTNESATAAQGYVCATGSVSIKHTLLASSETIQLYLVNYASTVALSATLSGGASYQSASGIHLGYTDDNFHYCGILTLTVSGATVGETLTFTISSVDRSADSNSASVAIQAASVTTVPEPHSAALLFSGVLGLLAYAWRKRRS